MIVSTVNQQQSRKIKLNISSHIEICAHNSSGSIPICEVYIIHVLHKEEKQIGMLECKHMMKQVQEQ